MRVKRRAPLKSCCSNKRKRRRITNSAGVPAGTCICCGATVPTPGPDSHRGAGSVAFGGSATLPALRRLESAPGVGGDPRRLGQRGEGLVRESVRPTLPVVGVVLAVVALVLGVSA